MSHYYMDGSAMFHEELSVVSIPGHFRVKCVKQTKYKDGRDESYIRWGLLRPDGYYVIAEKAAGQFLLQETRSDITSPLLGVAPPLNLLTAPLRSVSHPINRLIAGEIPHDSFKVTDFQRHPGNSSAAFTFRASIETHGDRGEMDFTLNERWLVTRKINNSKASGNAPTNAPAVPQQPATGRSRKNEISYTTLGERMLPLRITTQIFEASGQAKTPPSVIEFRNYRVYEGSVEDFSFAQFGLPDPTSFRARVTSRWYLWFIAIAVVSLALGAYFRRRVRNRKAALAQSPSL